MNNMVAISAIEDMKTFYSYTQSKEKNSEAIIPKSGTYEVRLKNIIIKNINNEIGDFYAPDLKFLLLPIVWDESGESVQCHLRENFEVLAGLGNIVLGSNNARELTDKNSVIFSSDNIHGHLGVMLAGIVFEKKTQLNKSLMNSIRKIVRKSQLNKRVRSIASLESIDESIEELFEQLSTKVEKIVKIYCFANYKSDEILQSCNPLNPILLKNENIHIVIQGKSHKMMSIMPQNKGLPFFDVIPNLNGDCAKSSGLERSIGDKQHPVELLSSSYGMIESMLVTIPVPYLEEYQPPYTSYLDIIKEFPLQFPGKQLTLLIETRKQQPDKYEQATIDALKESIQSMDLLIMTTPKAERSFSLWAQDAFLVAQTHEISTTGIIISPSEYLREDKRNDGSIAREVADRHPAGYASRTFPAPIEAGNILIADDFVLVGKDEILRSEYSEAQFTQYFSRCFGTKKKLIVVHCNPKDFEPIYEDNREKVKTRSLTKSDVVIDKQTGYQHSIYKWRGKAQPIFHIDLFITLLGRNSADEQIILIGEPTKGLDTHNFNDKEQEIIDEQIKDASDRINECIKNLKQDLSKYNIPYKILRNPLPLTYYTYAPQTVWYWASYNNCLVEISNNEKNVWLPRYHNNEDIENQQWQQLLKYDEKNEEVFQQNGFNTYLFNHDFHALATNNGALHCMTKCLKRSNNLWES